MNPLAPLCCCNLIRPRCNTQVQGWASWLAACLTDQSGSVSTPPSLCTPPCWVVPSYGLGSILHRADSAPQFSLKRLKFLWHGRLMGSNIMLMRSWNTRRSLVHIQWLAGWTGSGEWINNSLFSLNTYGPVVLEQITRPPVVPVSQEQKPVKSVHLQ